MSIHDNIRNWEDDDGPNLMKEIGITPNSKVLDVGCGYGHYSIAIQKNLSECGRIIALDKNRQILKMFQSRNLLKENIEYLNISLEDISKELIKEMDYILLFDMIHGGGSNRFEFFEFIKKHIKDSCIISILPFHLSNFRDREGKKRKYSYKKIIDEMEELGFVLCKEFKDKGIHFEKYHSPTIMERGELTFNDLERGSIFNFKLKV